MRRIDVVGLVLLVAIGCRGGDTAEPAPAPPPTGTASAETTYAAQACAMCHGEQAEGNANGPALQELAPYWTAERLVEYLRDPDAFRAAHADFDARRTTEYAMIMPAYDHVDDAELEALARWLMAR